MEQVILGRTNRRVYPRWVLGALRGSGSAEEQAEALLQSLLNTPVEVIDITPAVGLWGHLLRKYSPALQTAVICPAHLISMAGDARIASVFLQSHIIEMLCAIGREHIDYYFLSLDQPIGEAQLSGALEALEIARQEGQIRATGIACYGDPLRTLALWRTHDAFEVALIPDEPPLLQALLPEARHRRVGVVLRSEQPLPIEQTERLQQRLHETGTDVVLAPIEPREPTP
ncbi:MAG: hypothetical protein SNJ72_10250 [Fimbriimonadales bacterium]